MVRKELVALALAMLAMLALLTKGSGAHAQEKYPSQPVQVILPFAAGGGVDIMGRAFSAEMGRILGQQFFVVNRDGGGGSIGFGALAAARPDGHTLVFSPATPITNVPHVMKNLSYSFDSFTPVCQVFENVFAVAVLQASPLKTLQDLLDAARAQPDRLRYGHAGLGSIPHLSMAALASAAGVKMTQVPYRGDAQMLPQLMGGEIEFGVPAISSISGRGLRVLVVFSDKRHPGEPNAAAVTELGYPYIPPGLNGVYALKGTPRRVLDTLETACEQATKSDAFRAQAAKLTQPVVFMKGEDFAKRLAADYDMKGKLIREIGLKQE